MSKRDKLNGTVQQSILTVLAFRDEGKKLLDRIDTQDFEGSYKPVATALLNYWEKWEEPPGEAHLDDCLAGLIGGNSKMQNTYRKIMDDLLTQHKRRFNTEFVLEWVDGWVEQQNLKRAIYAAAAEFNDKGDDADRDRVKTLLRDASNIDGVRHGLTITRGSDIEIEPIRWLWPYVIPRGALTLFVGKPDSGKTTLVINLAARITTRQHWPNSEDDCAPLGDVIILAAEDSMEQVLVPRLIAARGNPHRLLRVGLFVNEGSSEQRVLSLKTDLHRLADLVDNHPQCQAIIIDPVSDYMGNANTWSDSELRQVLAPISKLAEDKDIPVIGIMHLNKASDGDAMSRTIGSIGFTGKARASYLIINDNSDLGRLDDVHMMLPIKSNWAPRDKQPKLKFEIRSASFHTRSGAEIETSCITWSNGVIKLTADEALQGPRKERAPKRKEAEAFLRRLLADGPVLVTEIEDAAKEAGIAWDTVLRAKGRCHDIQHDREKKASARVVWLLSTRSAGEHR
jgi:AAA domain-containing protein